MKPFSYLLPCLRAALPAAMLLAAPAWAGLMLHPTRVVFDKNQRAAQVDLINDADDSATYRITVVERRMTDTGEFVAADTPQPGEHPAEPMLRFSPHQVTLAPHSSQTVRLMVRKPADLADGEYRSHLRVERLPPPAGNASAEAASESGQQIGIVLNVLVGASIPVIVRHGDATAAVALSHLALDGDRLALQLDRSGNASVYGDIAVSFVSRAGADVPLARAAGVAVYTPNSLRRASLVLAPPKGVVLAHGAIKVSYRERPEAGGRLLAEASLPLP